MKKSPLTTQHTQTLRKAARAIDALCGIPGQIDARELANTAHFVAYVQPVLEVNGFTPVLAFSEADFDEDEGCVARYMLADDGETLFIDIGHDGHAGWLLRSWVDTEHNGLDLREFLPLAA